MTVLLGDCCIRVSLVSLASPACHFHCTSMMNAVRLIIRGYGHCDQVNRGVVSISNGHSLESIVIHEVTGI